jgi:hypothetical protein
VFFSRCRKSLNSSEATSILNALIPSFFMVGRI